MLVDELINKLEKHKGKELDIGTAWVEYKIIAIDDYKGKCDITLAELWEEDL